MSDTYARYCAKEVMSVEASKQIFKEDAYYNGQCKPGIKRLGSSQKRQGWNLEQDSLILHHGVTASHLWRSAAAAAAKSLQSCPTLCASCSRGDRPLVELYVEPAGFPGRCTGVSVSRDITLPTKVCLVKAMVFAVVMYGCESWTRKKAEC